MDFTKNKNAILFLVIVIFMLLLAVLSNQFLVSDTLFYNSFAEQLTADKIDALIDQTQQWAWLGYVFIPIIYLLRACLGFQKV